MGNKLKPLLQNLSRPRLVPSLLRGQFRNFKRKWTDLKMSWFTKKKSSKPSPTNSTKRLPRCPAIKRERPAHTYLLHYYSIPPHPLLLFFLQKKFVWKFFQSTTALQHKFTPYFYSSKKFSY